MSPPRWVPLNVLTARLGCNPQAVLRRVNSPGSPGRTACGAYDLQAWAEFSAAWRGKGSRDLLCQAAPFDRDPVVERVQELVAAAQQALRGNQR